MRLRISSRREVSARRWARRCSRISFRVTTRSWSSESGAPARSSSAKQMCRNSVSALRPTIRSSAPRLTPTINRRHAAAAAAARPSRSRFGWSRWQTAATTAARCEIRAALNNVFGLPNFVRPGAVAVLRSFHPVDFRTWADGPHGAGPRDVLSVIAGYDARAPFSIREDPAEFAGTARARLQRNTHRMGRRFWRTNPVRSRGARTLRRVAQGFRNARM